MTSLMRYGTTITLQLIRGCSYRLISNLLIVNIPRWHHSELIYVHSTINGIRVGTWGDTRRHLTFYRTCDIYSCIVSGSVKIAVSFIAVSHSQMDRLTTTLGDPCATTHQSLRDAKPLRTISSHSRWLCCCRDSMAYFVSIHVSCPPRRCVHKTWPAFDPRLTAV